MPTAFDVPAEPLLKRVAEALRKEAGVEPPVWASFAKTGIHKEKAPSSSDWWYVRAAAVLRKVYVKGPIGSTRLSAEYGGKADNGSAPSHAQRGSRAISRLMLKQLEKAGYVQAIPKQGRRISAKGQKLLDSVAREVLKELIQQNPGLAKLA